MLYRWGQEAEGMEKFVKILIVERIRLVITPKTGDQQICSLTC